MKYKANCKVGDKVMVECKVSQIAEIGEPQIFLCLDGWNFELSRVAALEKGLIRGVHEVKVGQVYADEDDVDACNAWEVIHIKAGYAIMIDADPKGSADTWTGNLTDKYFCKDNLVKDVD